jgi:hypothetical protein
MKKIFLILFLYQVFLFGQYNNERTAEQSFEQSDLYFNSHYLNTFGLTNFKNVSVGLVDDPFLNLYLNPAILPQMDSSEFHLYFDFRGDRTTAAIVDDYTVPNYFITDVYYRPYYDPRWFTTTRTEPEPTISIGLLTYPVKEIDKNIFLGGTYQFVHRQEKYYTPNYNIYNSRLLYDAVGVKNEMSSVPIVDRYSGKDEMTSEGHLYSIFAGYKILDNLSFGVSLNGIVYSRDGGYLNSYKDDYGNIDQNKWENMTSQERNQNYHHLDFSGGLSYQLTPNLTLGVKAGLLNGNADQDYLSKNSYNYQYKEPNVTTDWSYNFSQSFTDQHWKQDGKTKYISINFSKKSRGKEIIGYYRYTKADINLNNSSSIFDTSFYSSKYIDTYDANIYTSNSFSSTNDNRTGTGLRTNKKNEGTLILRWELNSFSSISFGFYYQNLKSDIFSSEPVIAAINSEHHYHSSLGTYNYDYSLSTYEDKTLEWKYSSEYWTFQIPLLVNFKISENFILTLGVNRILKGWEITDVTTAYYAIRRRIENGVLTEAKLFGERYTQPTEKITENTTDFIVKFDVLISPQFKVSAFVDPEWDHQFRVAQWWLSFNAEL